MKNLIFSLFILFTSCKGQIKNQTNINKMEKINIEEYKELPINSETGLQILQNGDEVQIFKGANNVGYVKKEKKRETPFEDYKVYFENCNLQLKSTYFYSFPYGTSTEFDENGNIIKETNHDLSYKFSIEDLALKIKKEFKIDIMKKSPWIKIMRFVENSKSFYLFSININENKQGNTKEILIDGATGANISEKTLKFGH
jgi:hypothetical protein